MGQHSGDSRGDGHLEPRGGDTSRRHVRAVAALAATAGLVVVIAAYVVLWATAQPGVVQGTPASARGPAQVVLQTVGALGPRYSNPDWVSYLARDPKGHWHRSTRITAPAHSLLRVTIYQYDSATGLRNGYFSRVQGTGGGTMDLNGRRVQDINPNQAAHTFAIPQMGVYVPLPGVRDNAPNQCAAAPCTLAQAHQTVTFTIRTKGPGRYRFQCFVPCGAGFYSGNGGPMQTFGYMSGYLTVV